MKLRYGYNTNGLAHHRLEDAIELIAALGYDGVALTLDHVHLDPLHATAAEVARVARWLRARSLAVVVETGARFVLDPRRKHRPSLVERDPLARARRVAMLRRSIEIARDLGAGVVTIATGPRGDDDDGKSDASCWLFLEDGLRAVLDDAARAGVTVALEPEPGHFIDTLEKFRRARARLESVSSLGLALDVSHLSVAEPEPAPADAVRAFAGELAAVHVEDCRQGVHEHLPFGEGSLELAPFLGALASVGFGGLVTVELSRHSHSAPDVAARAIAALRAAERDASA